MQSTTSEKHVQLVERAKALLARSKPGVTLGELHLQALQLLVASLEKRRFAVTDRPRKRAVSQLAPEQAISPSRSGPALDDDAGVAEHIETSAPFASVRDDSSTRDAARAHDATKIRSGRAGPALRGDTLPRAAPIRAELSASLERRLVEKSSIPCCIHAESECR
jgi:hypothetical protein